MISRSNFCRAVICFFSSPVISTSSSFSTRAKAVVNSLVACLDGLLANADGQVGLAHPGRADEHQVGRVRR